jgi:hypothetical protein
MKTLLPLLTLVLILALSVMSPILYLRENYTSSALLTVACIVGISLWIGARGIKEKEAK